MSNEPVIPQLVSIDWPRTGNRIGITYQYVPAPAATVENGQAVGVGSGDLLGLGLYVIESRSRSRDKNLGPWMPDCAFVDKCNAEQYLQEYESNGYLRLVLPNK